MSKIHYASASITTYLYAAWKCSKCGNISFAKGRITAASIQYYGLYKPGTEEKTNLENRTIHKYQNLRDQAYHLYDSPGIIPNLGLSRTTCSKCHHSEKWNKPAMASALPFFLALLFFFVLLILIAVFTTGTPPIIIIIFAILCALSIVGIVFSIRSLIKFESQYKDIPRINMPVILEVGQQEITNSMIQGLQSELIDIIEHIDN